MGGSIRLDCGALCVFGAVACGSLHPGDIAIAAAAAEDVGTLGRSRSYPSKLQPSCNSVTTSLVHVVKRLLCGATCVVVFASCGFPRPADLVSDAPVNDASNDDAVIVGSADALADTQSLDAQDPDGPAPHESYLEPRYLPDICDVVATSPEFTVDNTASLSTTLDAACTGGIIAQDGGPDICVLRYGTIQIAGQGQLVVNGTRALALVADSAVRIDGILEVGGRGRTNGPGGGTMKSGVPSTADGGGGGAGFATSGAAGGSASGDGGGGTGGDSTTDPALVTVLLGGGHSVGPISLRVDPPLGGGGGGAVTIIACRGEVSVTGTISASGGGGEGGKRGLVVDSFFAGCGGGAGGNVVMQGMSVTITGQLFANGGGGGAGGVLNSGQTIDPGQPGSDGKRSSTDNASGGIGVNGAGSGGTGGRQGMLPTIGLHPPATSGFPGGGGGSVGFFQTYTPMGVVPTLTPSAASPVLKSNRVIKTR